MVANLIIIALTFVVFLILAKVSEKREHMGWAVAGIAVAVFELLLVFNCLELMLNKIP